MARYECSVCGYVHDESAEGSWDDLSDDWQCPVCGAAKSQFQRIATEQSKSSGTEAAAPTPSRAIAAHRVFGYIFLAIYIVLMIQMVPRLWNYQIEFPARSVVHISLGMAVGVVLILKIAVVRFFRRLDQALVPSLGTFLLVSSVVLIGISVPSAFREALATGRLLDAENRQRVGTLLARTGLDEEECTRLTTKDSLRRGQRLLRQECVDCHDLRTVLAKPRTPENWRQTVRRMADRAMMLKPLEEEEQRLVTAYLVALSPGLQKSTRQLRDEQARRVESQHAAETAAMEDTDSVEYDPVAAKMLLEDKCSQCHGMDVLDLSPPSDQDEAHELVARMVDEGLEATANEIAQIVRYLTESYATAPEQ